MLRCPVCHIPLCRIEYEGVPIHLCPDCRGSLVTRDAFRTIERRRDGEGADAERAATSELAAASDTAGDLACPECAAPMAKVKVPGPKAALRLDLCKACGLAWFDRGELEAAQIEYEKEEDARGPRELSPETRAALAMADFQIEADRRTIRGDLAPLEALGYVLAGPMMIPIGALVGAAKAARWAAENYAEGVEASGRARRGHLVMAAIGLAAVALLVVAAFWMRGCVREFTDAAWAAWSRVTRLP